MCGAATKSHNESIAVNDKLGSMNVDDVSGLCERITSGTNKQIVLVKTNNSH